MMRSGICVLVLLLIVALVAASVLMGEQTPAQPNSPPAPAKPDEYKYAGLPPKKAASVMTVPEGFSVKLFAGEPDVKQPIAMCFDDRGRLWIAEAYCYPNRKRAKTVLLPPGKEGDSDRILIFEDTKGSGTFDKRTVFMDGLNLVSGLEVGFGGVWIGAAPYLLYVPIKPGEDKPAGPPQVLLDGWGYEDTHETLNTFMWGPDGWLYGCHGIFTHSRVGKPGTPAKDRIPINAGIWRYHPTRHVFEVFAHGTSNPWGMDFNDRGQLFCEACVIPHAFHIIQGGRYHRQSGSHFNPHTYADISTIADHLHYLGGWSHAANDRSGSAGGGHAHCGTMIYLGGAWPREYRGQWFMGNIHGRRINVETLKPKGSGYIASHSPDFLLANDAWARFINLRYGPDGNVFLIDWYDKQACHNHDNLAWDRSNGRIYKVCYRGTKPVQVDLQKKTDRELVALQLHENDWYVRHARRLLQERGGNAGVHAELDQIAFGNAEETRRLRGLWALHVTGGLTAERIAKGLNDVSGYVRGWTIQLALEKDAPTPALLKKLTEMARKDSSQVVRLYLASAAQRLPFPQRWQILEGLTSHAEDATDHNLPLMYWYAAEPLADVDSGRALDLAWHAKVPMLDFMVRRIVSSGKPDALTLLVGRLAKTDDPAIQLMVLSGIQNALRGQRRLQLPDGWQEAYAKLNNSKNTEVRRRALSLAVKFGDATALQTMREMLTDAGREPAIRLEAMTSLLAVRDKELPPILHSLLAEPSMCRAALLALAEFDHVKTPEVILAVYSKLGNEEKRAALSTLTSRASYGRALMEAVPKQIPRSDLPTDLVQRMLNLRDKELTRLIEERWGTMRATPGEIAREIVQIRRMLKRPTVNKPDLSLGRAIFTRTCSQCHTLYGEGGKVGPDLTGSDRANLDYLLAKIMDPSAVITKDYAETLVVTKEGQQFTGIIKESNPKFVRIVNADKDEIIQRADIEVIQPTGKSMMPNDILKTLSETEIRALIAYLRHHEQVPLKPEHKTK